MAFCSKCGAPVEDGVKFCSKCGAPVNGAQAASAQAAGTASQNGANTQANAQQFDLGEKISSFNDTTDTTSAYAPNDIAANKGMSVLAYIGILWLIPFFAKKDQSPYVKYHCCQGLTLLLIGIGYSVISAILRAIIRVPYKFLGVTYGYYTPAWLNVILGIVGIPLLVWMILGIVNAASGKAKELPIIGKFKLLK